MKYINIFLALALFCLTKSCVEILSPKSKGDCNGKLTDAEKGVGAKYCCFAEKNGEKACVPIDQATYDLIPDQKIDGTFDCNSSFIKYGLIGLILVLL